MCESIIVGVQRCCSYVMHLSYNHSIANIHPALTSTELRVSVIVKSTYLCIAFIFTARRIAASVSFMFQLEKKLYDKHIQNLYCCQFLLKLMREDRDSV